MKFGFNPNDPVDVMTHIGRDAASADSGAGVRLGPMDEIDRVMAKEIADARSKDASGGDSSRDANSMGLGSDPDMDHFAYRYTRQEQEFGP